MRVRARLHAATRVPSDASIATDISVDHWRADWHLAERAGDSRDVAVERLRGFEVTLHAGDVLYVPRGLARASRDMLFMDGKLLTLAHSFRVSSGGCTT